MMRVSVGVLRFTIAFAFVMAAGCNDRTPSIIEPEPVVHALVRVAGDSMSGEVATPLTTLTVRAEDARGTPLTGVAVRFFIPMGSSGLIDTAIVYTNSEGLATSGMWMLGTRSGIQHVRAHAQDIATVFTAFVAPDIPVGMFAYAGDQQVTLASTPVRVPPTVRVVDRFGNGVPDVVVHFTPASSSVASTTAITDSTGNAEALEWTPGGSTNFSIVATSDVLPGSTVTFRSDVVSTLFEIRFVEAGAPIPQRLKQALERAAARWMTVFTDHSGQSQVTLPAGSCGSTSLPVSENVRDIMVFVRVTPIDGTGEILASALPCALHEESGLPAVARITFDSSDVAQYVANDWIDLIATHELGHALGFGTVWEQRGLVVGAGTINPRFTGVAASREYGAAFGSMTGVVPLENTGGAGTAARHWRASVFPAETMNGFIESRVAPLSSITVGAMEDIGYRVNYDRADAFPSASAFEWGPRIRLQLRHEEHAPVPVPIMPRVTGSR